jgi:hypothetical protein
MWLVLRSLRTRSVVTATLAGLFAGTALGLKQNLVGAVLFGALMLVGQWATRALSPRDVVRVGAAFLSGALLHLILTLAWARGEGVRLSALWYAVFGFRAEALDVILAGPLGGPLARAADIVAVAFSTGLVLLLLWFTLSLRRLGRERPVLTLSTLAVLAVDGASVVLGGSYWRPYLFGLVPAAVLSLALLASGTPATAHRPARSRLVTGAVVAVMVAGCVFNAVQWVRTWPSSSRPSTAVLIGRGIGDVARPGDTLTIWGGRADVQLASGMPSPYEHLWSLPARTRDPGAERLAGILRGPRAPTWFVTWADVDAWEGAAAAVAPVLRERYVKVATACGGREVYRLRTEPRAGPSLSCRALRAARANTDP